MNKFHILLLAQNQLPGETKRIIFSTKTILIERKKTECFVQQ